MRIRKTLNDKEMFDEVVHTILSVMGDDVVKIILYGSVARGDNTWESDVDIAVISSQICDDKERHAVYDAAAGLDLKYDALFSVVIIDEKRFNEWLFDLPLYYSINEEGIALWTRDTA